MGCRFLLQNSQESKILTKKKYFWTFWSAHIASGILVPQSGIEPVASAMEVQILFFFFPPEVQIRNQ